jgi:hypothetical protein
VTGHTTTPAIAAELSENGRATIRTTAILTLPHMRLTSVHRQGEIRCWSSAHDNHARAAPKGDADLFHPWNKSARHPRGATLGWLDFHRLTAVDKGGTSLCRGKRRINQRFPRRSRSL